MFLALVKNKNVDAVVPHVLGPLSGPLFKERIALLFVLLDFVEFLLQLVGDILVGLNEKVDLVLFEEAADDFIGLADGLFLEEAAVVADFRDGSRGQAGGEQPAGDNR